MRQIIETITATEAKNITLSGTALAVQDCIFDVRGPDGMMKIVACKADYIVSPKEISWDFPASPLNCIVAGDSIQVAYNAE